MRGQVGQTSLAVVPTMKGFRGKVNAESKAAARAAGKSMTSEFGRTGVEAGRKMGQGIRAGTVESERLVKDMNRANAASTAEWSKANRANLDTLGQVRVAQAKLNDAVQKYGEGSTQAIVAQERLGTAQRRAEETAVRLVNAQTRLTGSQQALRAAQDALAARPMTVWRQMAADLVPVSSRMASVTLQMAQFYRTSQLMTPIRAMVNGLSKSWTVAGNVMSGIGPVVVRPLMGQIAALGQRASGAFNGFLMQSPMLNMAFTKVSDGVKRVMGSVAGGAQVFGAFGRAAMTGVAGIGRALGPGLASAFTGLNSMISQSAQAFTSVLGGAAVATGLVIAGAMTKAMVGGFSRLSGIENAEAKMRGLGFAATDIETVMADASDAVDGTAFALDEMATAASIAMAAGIKPGAQLNQYMSRLKNSAAAANVPLGEMGQILNKTITSGRAYTLEINQIADRGLPIWSKLAEAYGVTADELRDMVSRGEVDTETFMRVMDDMTGSVADEMGGTTQAAIRNFGTALSKLGADMLQGLYPVIGPLFNALKSGIQMIQTFGAPAFEAFGAVFQPLIEKLTSFNDGWTATRDAIKAGATPLTALRDNLPGVADMLERVSGAVGTIRGAFESMGAGIAPVIGGLLGTLGPLLSKLPLIGGAFSGITGPVGIFIGVLVAAWQQSESFRTAIAGVFEALVSAVGPVLEQLGPLLATLGTAFTQIAGVIGDVLGAALTALTPLIEPVMAIFSTLIEAVMPLVPVIAEIATIIGGVLVEAFTALTPLVELVGTLLTAVSPIITMVGEVVGMLLTALMPLIELIGTLVNAILPPLVALFEAVLPPIMGLVQTILDALMPVIEGLIQILTGLIDFVTGVLTGNWEQAWNGIKGVFEGFVNTIGGLVSGLGKILGGIYDTVMGVLGGIGSWLVDSGRALIDGLVEGIMAGFEWAGEKISQGLDFLRGFLPNSPAKRGPLSGAGWTKLKSSGMAYMQQWTLGVTAGAEAFSMPDILAAADGTGSLLAGGLTVAGRASGPAFPETVTLVDADGSILTQAKVIATDTVDGSNQAGGRVVRRGSDRRF